MTAVCLPIDADPSTSLPAFPAALHRAALAAVLAPSDGRPLGAKSGVRVAPAVTVDSAGWSVSPFNGVLDPPDTSPTIGPYFIAFTETETGSINAADQTSTRYDRLDVCVPDDPPGSDPREPWIQYTPGDPGSGDVPAAPKRSMPCGAIMVPAAGTGSPSWVPSWQYLDTARRPGALRNPAVQLVNLGTASGSITNGYSALSGWYADQAAPGGIPGFDELGLTHTSGGVFTLPEDGAGRYKISANVCVQFDTGDQGSAFYCQIGRQGASGNFAQVTSVRGTSSLVQAVFPGFEVDLAGGDSIAVAGQVAAGASAHVQSASVGWQSWFRIERTSG